MNKRQAKKRFKKIFGEKIWRMRMPEPRKNEKCKWLISEKDIKEAEKRRNKKRISQLMKNAAKKIRKLSPEDADLAEKLLTEAEKNDRRSV